MLANRLKELREKNGLTQEQVANYLGVDQSLITRIEKGERNIQVSYLEALSSLYGCDLVNEDTDPIVIKYRAKEINNDDLKMIARIKRIALNLREMEELDED